MEVFVCSQINKEFSLHSVFWEQKEKHYSTNCQAPKPESEVILFLGFIYSGIINGINFAIAYFAIAMEEHFIGEN